jgi:hypothetical protein
MCDFAQMTRLKQDTSSTKTGTPTHNTAVSAEQQLLAWCLCPGWVTLISSPGLRAWGLQHSKPNCCSLLCCSSFALASEKLQMPSCKGAPLV